MPRTPFKTLCKTDTVTAVNRGFESEVNDEVVVTSDIILKAVMSTLSSPSSNRKTNVFSQFCLCVVGAGHIYFA